MKRPDLSNSPLEVRVYIQYLEEQIQYYKNSGYKAEKKSLETSNQEGNASELIQETESDAKFVTVTRNGFFKKAPRFLYVRQHRGGIGISDMNSGSTDSPISMYSVTDQQHLLVFTNFARVFRFPVSSIPLGGVKSYGIPLFEKTPLAPDEYIVCLLPDQARGLIAMLGSSGKVRCLRHHLFGEHMKQGTIMFNWSDFGMLTCATWTPGDADLMVVTSKGIGIRFNEKLISPQGDIAIRLSSGDEAVGITSVYPDDQVFLVGVDGKGTIRKLSGFAPNKTPGGSGKIAFKNDSVVGICAVGTEDELFLYTKNGKVIRFFAREVPETDGVVQGVNCIMLRSDQVTGMFRLPRI